MQTNFSNKQLIDKDNQSSEKIFKKCVHCGMCNATCPTHQLLGDELDEIRFGGNSRTIIFDFTDLDNPKYHMDYIGTTPAIDHNGYVKGSTYFQANYAAGVRMIDISNIENKALNEIGFFDTYPENNNATFKGAWSVYPYLPSGNIIISDIDSGLFVIRKSEN